jgi:hypothetical protein
MVKEGIYSLAPIRYSPIANPYPLFADFVAKVVGGFGER